MEMTYSEVAPPPDLAPWVAAFWSFTVTPSAGEIEHTIPLTGGVILSLSHGELFLVGPRAIPLKVMVRGGETYRGVHFLPGATSSLFHLSGEKWRDLQMPARFAIDPSWCDRLIAEHESDDAFVTAAITALRSLTTEAAPYDPLVVAAVARLRRSEGMEKIGDLATATGLSPRQFRRRFSAAAGLSPKELARIVRLRAAATKAAVLDESWIDVVATYGFADQPHLIREFRSILGVSPTEFGAHVKRIRHRGAGFE